MKKVLFISWAGPGHWNPLLAVAQEVLALGQAAEWICVTSVDGTRMVKEELGRYPFRLHIREHHPALTGAPHPDDFAGYLAWSKKVHFGDLERRVESVRRIIRAIKPDVIAVSGLVYEGVIAAHREGIPYACLSTELTPLLPTGIRYQELDVADQLSRARRKWFGRFGFVPGFRCNECVSPFQNFVFTTEKFIGDAGPRPVSTQLVGPALPSSTRIEEAPFPWERLVKNKKVVYAAVGSQLSLGAPEIRAMALATARIGAQLVVATGGEAPMDFRGDAIVVSSAPQRALLARASAFITHGGANSVMEALYCGVPMLVLPVRYDQPLNAHFVVQAGVGLRASRVSATLLATLLSDHSIRSRMAQVRASYRKYNGAVIAAREIISLAL